MQKYLYCFLACVIASTGCEKRDLIMEDMLDSQMVSANIDSLSRTMELVLSESRFDRDAFEQKISTGLNRWVSEVTKGDSSEDEWQLGDETQALVKKYESLAVLDRIDEVNFLSSDGYFIQQAAWLKQIGKRVLDSEKLAPFELYRLAANLDSDDETFVEIVARLNPKCSEEDSEKLADAIRLFDWVTRNIQLTSSVELQDDQLMDNLLVPDSTKSPEELIKFYTDPDNRPAGGIRGLGYTHFPYQTLVYGRGDNVEKARLFIVLCHQSGLDAVMLAVKGEDGNRVPWLPAVVLGDQLYLFDSLLGLPLPGQKLGSVATLAEVQENKDLLSGLDLTLEESTRDETDYRVTSDQVDEVIVLVYASPNGISRRMKFLEDRLIGDQRLRLTSNVKDVVQALEKFENVSVELWDVGFKTQQFRAAFRSAVKEAEFDSALNKKLEWYYTNESYIDAWVRYRTARNLYFLGKFETERNSKERSAIELFSKLMYSEETIASLDTDKNSQIILKIRRGPGQSNEDLQSRLSSVKSQMRLVRRDAGLFLAQSCFDFGNIGTCSNWLTRVVETGQSERWNTGIEYLKGRSFEAIKDYDQAIEIYEKGDYDQYHGNLIRARMLKSAKQNKSS